MALLPGMAESFQQQLVRLRAERRLSRNKLSQRTVSEGDMGVSPQTIEALETKPGQTPQDRTILLLGRALEARFGEFPAYDLARARRLFDERAVGADDALAALSSVKDRLDFAAAERSARTDFGEGS